MQSTPYSCHNSMKVEFCRRIFEKSSDTHFMNILLLGAELFHAYGRAQTYVMKPVVTLRNSAKKNGKVVHV